MKHERIRKLKEILERVRDQDLEFDIRQYYNGKPGLCGTAACGLGWAALDPDFQLEGLRPEGPTFGNAVIFRQKKRRPAFGMEAGRKFFGMPGEVSYYLFSPFAYPKTLSQRKVLDKMIDRIEELLADKKKITERARDFMYSRKAPE